jgi:hypothetical protein
VTFRSKAVVLSNGGSQSVPDSQFKLFPAVSRDRYVLADHLLRRDYFKQILTRIKEQRLKKIVIVGGSHSGFSSAWLLLNGPATYNKNLAAKPQTKRFMEHPPSAPIKSITGCTECCTSQSKGGDKCPGGANCQCQCKCYGWFQFRDWEYDHATEGIEHDLLKEEGAYIKILYRDRIKVFYSRVKDAEFDGYTDFKPLSFSNKNGFLYSFTGLRGDAKRLYKRIMKGEEKRVQLVKAETPDLQRPILEDADVIIWAAGYHTTRIQIKDFEGKEIGLSQRVPFTQFDVDNKCRLLTSDNSILTKTFGTGIAYPLRTSDGMIIPDAATASKGNPRADSFSLYLNFVADTILKSILPKTKLDNKLHKTLRAERKPIASKEIMMGVGAGGSMPLTTTGGYMAPPIKSANRASSIKPTSNSII